MKHRNADAASRLGEDARSYLHRRTHDAHVRLNAHPLLRDITREGYPREHYLKVLTAYFHAYGQIEAGIRVALDAHPDAFSYAGRWKRGWLADDLAHFGIAPAPCVQPVQLGASADALFGVMYVVEGSSLGGRLIASRLRQTLGLGPDNGARFFHGYGEAVDAHWTRFVAALGQRLDGEAARACAAEAATATFNLIESHLDEQCRPNAC